MGSVGRGGIDLCVVTAGTVTNKGDKGSINTINTVTSLTTSLSSYSVLITNIINV